MSTAAIVMMVVALTVVWGGLLLAVVNLVRRGRPPEKVARGDL